MLIAWLVSTDPYLAEMLDYAALTGHRMRSWLARLAPVLGTVVSVAVLFVLQLML
jgi:hypothetical protein